MSQKLTKSAQSVQMALDTAGLECEVLELTSTTRTASDAAISISCEPTQIVKSLIFKTVHTGKPVLVLASGPNLVDMQKIASYVGEGVAKADASFVREVTGFAIGGVPPIGHLRPIEHIFIDEDLMAHSEVWAAAGTPNAVFCIKAKALAEITFGKIVSVSTAE